MKKLVHSLVLLLALTACKGNSDASLISADGMEVAQQLGDVMSSVDEYGAGSSTISSIEKSIRRDFQRLAPNEMQENMLAKLLLPDALAVSCLQVPYSSCSGGGQRVKNYNSCTVGGATFTGTVTLNWSNGTTCAMAAVNQHVLRVPNLTVTGRLGATLTITKAATEGQKIELATNGSPKTFLFSSDGINRKFTEPGGRVLMNFTTTTTAPITVTGGDRPGRKMTGGAIQVTNHINSVTCSYAPNNLTWTADCNCPTSGSWNGSCSDGTTASVAMNGCGLATVTYDSSSESITFDRCGN